jgi:hypothetical protein
LKVNHQLESRMQEICQSGSEGGAEHTPSSLPLSQPRVSTLGPIQPKRVALNGRKITWADLTHIAPSKRKEASRLAEL